MNPSRIVSTTAQAPTFQKQVSCSYRLDLSFIVTARLVKSRAPSSFGATCFSRTPGACYPQSGGADRHSGARGAPGAVSAARAPSRPCSAHVDFSGTRSACLLAPERASSARESKCLSSLLNRPSTYTTHHTFAQTLTFHSSTFKDRLSMIDAVA